MLHTLVKEVVQWLHNVRCTGTDDNLIDCLQYSYLTRSLPSYCSRGHSQDAGVVCSGLWMVLWTLISNVCVHAKRGFQVYFAKNEFLYDSLYPCERLLIHK